MDNKELQIICGRVKNISKRLSMSLAPLGYNYVIFNNPQHILENISKYEDYEDRDVANILDGIVRNDDGKLYHNSLLIAMASGYVVLIST